MYVFMIAQATYERYRSLSVKRFLLYYVGYQHIYADVVAMVDNRRHAKRGNGMQMWWLWLIIVDTQRDETICGCGGIGRHASLRS
jgi:hypothetical protein